MDKTNKYHFIRSLKVFCINYIVCTLIYVIISKLLQYNKQIILYKVLFFVFFLALGSSIGYFKRYKKYSEKIMIEEVSNKEIVVNLQEIMKNMHWSIQNINREQIVFKSSVLRTYLTEYLIINIDENSLEFEGPKYYVEKVIESLQS